MAFTGNFLGAGFVSRQELTQFFAVFGGYGLLGMVTAVLMLLTLSCFVMKIARRTGTIDFDKIIIRRERPWLRAVFGGVFIFFLFGIVVVMTAGAGALLHQVFGIPKIWGNACMAVCLAILASWEAKGVLNVFRVTVPCLIVVAMISGVIIFLFGRKRGGGLALFWGKSIAGKLAVCHGRLRVIQHDGGYIDTGADRTTCRVGKDHRYRNLSGGSTNCWSCSYVFCSP